MPNSATLAMTQGRTDERTIIDGKSYPPVGHCIYCGSEESLTKEHILPFGLSGTATLPRSSCRACAAITGESEQILLRGSFWPVRVYRDLKSRTKHKDAPKEYPVTAVFGAREEELVIAVDRLPILLHFPLFCPPRNLVNKPSGSGIQVFGLATVLFGRSPEDLARELGATELRICQEERPAIFARVIAKIAYGFAYAEGAIHDLDGRSPVLESILGKQDNVGDWVGMIDKPFEVHPDTLHRIELHHDKKRGLLLAEVQLFADSQTPTYLVVLGPLRTMGA